MYNMTYKIRGGIKMYSLSDQQKQQIHQKCADLYLIAEKKLNRTFARPTISFNLTGAVAGTATYSKNLLRFNEVLCSQNLNYFLSNTVPHEISHLITRSLFPRSKPHGLEWKKIMKNVFNKEPKRTHSLDTSISSTHSKVYIYSCDCCTHEISSIRHNRALQGMQYRCCKCKKEIKFTGKTNGKEIKNITTTEKKDHEVTCPCGQTLGPIQLKRALAGVRYRCRICKQEFTVKK